MSKNPKYIPAFEEENRQLRSDPLTRGRRKHTDLSPKELADLKRDQARHYRKHGTGNILTAAPGTTSANLGNYKIVNKPPQPRKRKPARQKRGPVRYKRFD